MNHELTTKSMKKVLAEFVSTKAAGMTRRALRNYEEVLDLFGEFLEERGVTTLEWGAAPAAPVTKKRGATVEQVIALFDDFNEVYLVSTVKAEREFLRAAALTCRDLGRWLQTLGQRPQRRPSATTPVHA